MRRIVVVGNGMVGHRVVEELLDLKGAGEDLAITALGEEPRPAFDRVHLTDYLAGKTAEDLNLVAPGFYDQEHVSLHTGDPVRTIDPGQSTLTTAAGRTISWDALVLATGSRPFVPPIAGHDREHCYVYRTIEDLDAIKAASANSRHATVVGGGLLGLEAARALKELGLETAVVEFAPRLMPVQVDEAGGRLLRRKIEELGVSVLVDKNTSRIVAGETSRHMMEFADGSTLATDMIVFSAGIRPADELAAGAGLRQGARGGFAVDDSCRTSDPRIYAIGECAVWQDRVFGLVAPGYDMARVAARQIMGEDARFTGADMSSKLKLMGLDVASIGDAHARTEGARVWSFEDNIGDIYKKIVVSEDRKRLLGAILIGDAAEYGQLLQMALNDIPLPDQPESLILPAGSDAAPAFGMDALPDEAQICSCNNVTKGEVCQAVQDGCTAMGSIKECTGAATSCGGCAPLVKQILDGELTRQGIEVNNDICAHFAYSRQELFHIVKTERIKTFQQLLTSHGKGLGCEICKPAIGSILASCWNEHVLEPAHRSLQDTNDIYLANMQKDGTYSIVPRIPGGEIDPDKLMTIATVAKKWNLYTKITGGQRIDLFGARLEQLPFIWKELTAAGFVSGHAYGKALRTVKSCVGDTWCRFGVGDSLALAIELENRYRGIRAPHKVKMAVSGCTRECAEARGKDIGVIATEKGWNLYVCGNGGMKPRHADLLAGDLDRETLIRYIDRFMMFYVETADRLQRTSTWLEQLEGGLEYLRAVICDDSLGIADSLEKHMGELADSFACEWQETLKDPAKLRKFRHFANSSDPDDRVVFVRERGQIRPAKDTEKPLKMAIRVNQ